MTDLIERLERATQNRRNKTVYSVAEALRLKEKDAHNALIAALRAKEAENGQV